VPLTSSRICGGIFYKLGAERAGTANKGAVTEAHGGMILESSVDWKPVWDHHAVTNVSWEFTKEAKGPNVVWQ
jgi:hypothetical protein